MEGKHANPRSQVERLGFRVDSATKRLIERAANLEQRRVTDYCLTTLREAARRTVAEHEALMLSDRDRAQFFEVLMHPPEPNERLRRGLRAERERVRRD